MITNSTPEKTIRSILETLADENYDLSTTSEMVDDALTDLESIVYQCYDEDWYVFQSNLKERIG